MAPRPRLASDPQILAAVFRVVAQLGPMKLTLADVAKEAGLSPAALVQRFGSKRELLLAAAADAASGHAFLFAQARAKHASPLAALMGVADCLTLLGSTHDEVANSLAFFHADLADPDFRAHGRTGATTFQAGLRSLLRDAVAAGELQKCDVPALASTLYALIQGSLIAWAIEGEGQLDAWVKSDVRALLKGYR